MFKLIRLNEIDDYLLYATYFKDEKKGYLVVIE